jgi:hypothetical protein
MTPGTHQDLPRAPGKPADPATASADSRAASPVPFMVTKEHRRFAEFADAVRRDRYIGLCYGAPGVGKTLSARQYAGWDTVEPYLRAFRFDESVPVPEKALTARSIVYTPAVANTPRTVEKGVTFCHTRLSWGIGLTLYPRRGPRCPRWPGRDQRALRRAADRRRSRPAQDPGTRASA